MQLVITIQSRTKRHMGTPQDQMQTCLKTETLCEARVNFREILGNHMKISLDKLLNTCINIRRINQLIHLYQYLTGNKKKGDCM